MYKVFVNNKPLLLTDNEEEYRNAVAAKERFTSKKQLSRLLDQFEKKSGPDKLIVHHWDIDELFYYLRRACKYIHAAGGVVKNSEDQYLLIFRNGKWDLPKGKLEKGEHPEVGALREIEEECGVFGLEIFQPLAVTYHTYWMKDKRVLKKTWWYEIESDYNGDFIPQLEEGITEVRWMNKTEVNAIKNNTYKSIKEVIESISFE